MWKIGKPTVGKSYCSVRAAVSIKKYVAWFECEILEFFLIFDVIFSLWDCSAVFLHLHFSVLCLTVCVL